MRLKSFLPLLLLAILLFAQGCLVLFIPLGGTSTPGLVSPELAGPPAPAPAAAEILRELNLARQQPGDYARLMEGQLQFYQRKIIKRPGAMPIRTHEGADAVQEAIAYLRAARPLPPLRLSAGMTRAAEDHVRDLAARKLSPLGHKGNDGSRVGDRVNRYGQWRGTVGENISFGPETARDIVMALIVDDGVASRGHRTNIFNEQFNVAGAACTARGTYQTLCVIPLAGDYAER